jgi:2-keto-4-pentenoate hydratase
MIAPHRIAELRRLAELFLEARRTATPLTALAQELTPTSAEEAIFVQDTMATTLEPQGSVPARAWKIGAPAPDATPGFGPMIAAWIAPSGVLLGEPRHRLRGLEAEVAFLFGKPLPPRSTPYTREEVIDAIESCHPAIEELESAFPVPAEAPKLASMADLGVHGGFIYGPAVANWQSIDFAQETVTLAIDGVEQVRRTASNSAGTDLLRMLVYLANEGAARTGGLEKGSWVTTGSWTGNTFATAGQSVEIGFTRVGKASLRFA